MCRFRLWWKISFERIFCCQIIWAAKTSTICTHTLLWCCVYTFGWYNDRMYDEATVVCPEWVNRWYYGEWILHFWVSTFLALISLSSRRAFIKKKKKRKKSCFLPQLSPILPQLSGSPFCKPTLILQTGFYIVFEIIFGFLCLYLLLNKSVGLLPACLCA